jgi:hypothetical protein
LLPLGAANSVLAFCSISVAESAADVENGPAVKSNTLDGIANDTLVTEPAEAATAARFPLSLLIAETMLSEELTTPATLEYPTNVFPTTIALVIVGLGYVPVKSPPAAIPTIVEM